MARRPEEIFLDRLPLRTLLTINTLHIVSANHKYYSLDLDMRDESLPALLEKAVAYLESMPIDQVLPTAPLTQWKQIVGYKLLARRTLRFRLPNGYPLNYVVVTGPYQEGA